MLKTSLIIAFFIYSSIRCLDVCPFIAENGTYRGLQMYHRMVGPESGHTYVMFNRYGKEWGFEMNWLGSGFRFDLKNHSMKSYESPNVVNRFSTYHGELIKWCDCEIISNPGIPLILRCFDTKNVKRERFVAFHKDSVILEVVSPNHEHSILIFNKADQYEEPIIVKGCIEDNKQIQNCSDRPWWDITDTKPIECNKEPPFVKDMDSSLFKQIEGVVDYNPKRYLLLFNINGRPKTCLTYDFGRLSKECNSSDKMTPLFPECFQTGPLLPTPTIPPLQTTTVEPNNTKVWIIVAILILIPVMAAVIVIYYFCCRKKKRRHPFMNAFETASHETPHSFSKSVSSSTTVSTNKSNGESTKKDGLSKKGQSSTR